MRTAKRRTYDHRIRQRHVAGDESIVRDLGVPRSTAASWRRRGMPRVVTSEGVEEDVPALRMRVAELEKRAGRLLALVGLLAALVRVRGGNLASGRLPEAGDKATMLRAIARARAALPLDRILRAVGISRGRYSEWTRGAFECRLEDRPSCPRSRPMGLTAAEISQMKAMVTGPEYAHMSIQVLSVRAQRLGMLFATAATWYRYVRDRGWRRPKARIYPAKPKFGLRASRPNEIWNLDVTIIRLLDGTKTYLHAVIDNFSRRILSWTLELRLEPATTCRVLEAAATWIVPGSGSTSVVTDAGVENLNCDVDAFLEQQAQLRRIVAQVDIRESNSMIESFWRRLRHGWLYLNSLDTYATVKRLVGFYVDQHNEVMPHAAFRGQTPDEMFFGSGAGIEEQLKTARWDARKSRIAVNQAADCGACRPDERRSQVPGAT